LTGILCLQESRMEKHIVERGRERAGCTFRSFPRNCC
jgi:hypothetical protein